MQYPLRILSFALLALTQANASSASQDEPAALAVTAASACAGAGGKLIDDKTCQMPNGAVSEILSGAAALQARHSAIPVKIGSPQAWALATAAITFEYNGDRHDLLTGAIATPAGQQKGERLLATSWKIKSRADLLTMLTWLQTEGHRTEFDAMGRRVDALDDEQFRSVLATLAARNIPVHRLEVLRANYRGLGSKGILAWDLIRYIALCRWGNLAGYIADEEAWNLIMPAALRLQQTFESWQDLESDFLIGREYWSADQANQTGDRFREIYERLTTDARSPWNQNAWARDLGVAAAAGSP